MADQDDSEFAGPDDAKTEIRAAVGYLLRGATGGARGDIVQEIIAIVRQIASVPPERPNPLDDGLRPGAARLPYEEAAAGSESATALAQTP
ncbi:MAG TPA: hypothetical protein VK620_05730 [Bradyrhizobium sp.]|nr:hypothetical protein [Bradyrhizobium sp.]